MDACQYFCECTGFEHCWSRETGAAACDKGRQKTPLRSAPPRFHVHDTPTYSSRLNQVERWFGLIRQRAIRRGSLDSVPDLKRKINDFVEHYNQHPRPLMWTATKLKRLGKVICGKKALEPLEVRTSMWPALVASISPDGGRIAVTTDRGVRVYSMN